MRAFLILCLLAFALPGQGQSPASTESDFRLQHADSAQVEYRPFDETRLNELKADTGMHYRQPPSVAESLWQRLINWIGQFFLWLLNNAVTTDWGKVLMIALGVGILIMVTMMLLKVNAVRVFLSGADRPHQPAGTFHENIHEMNFDALIVAALQKQDYRLGIRLIFLSALKLLSDKQLLNWKPGKTNHDYVSELASHELKSGLNELSFFFEYAWYGKFVVGESTFHRVRNIFDDWKKKVL